MKQVKGDLIVMAQNGDFDVIVQGCNCFNTMGAGIALQIKNTLPLAYEADQKTKVGDPNKLGKMTTTSHLCNTEGSERFTIVNAYTQFRFDGRANGEMDVDYNAIRDVMRLINLTFIGQRVAYPMIGAGLAGGDWNIISEIIDQELVDVDHTLVVYEPAA